MRHVVLFSFGVGSWAAAKVVARRHGAQDVDLLLTDTRYEDEDTYRWGREAAANVGGRLIEIADGRDPWQVFFDVQFLGNSRVDPCSKILKRELAAAWLTANCDPSDTTVYVGIHWSERDRFEKWDKERGEWKGIKHRFAALGWRCEAPLCEPPLLAAVELHDWARREGMAPQRLYQLGFAHANCGGRCVKQGQDGWALLLRTIPGRFAECEAREEELRKTLGKDVSILRDRRGGKIRPMTLREFRERIEAGDSCDLLNAVGGCGCFAGDE